MPNTNGILPRVIAISLCPNPLRPPVHCGENYVTSPLSETAPDLADFHQRQGHAPRFAGKRREIAPGLRRDGTIRRSFGRTAAGKLAGVERWIRTPWQGGDDPPSKTRTPPPAPCF